MPQDVDLIIIGSGQGGMPLARDFAKAGKRVVLFERGKLGGSCVNYGCTPSKAFLAAAHNAGRARRAAPLGVHAALEIDVAAVMRRVRSVRDEWHDGSEESVAKAKIDLIRASAAFIGERTVAGGGHEVRAPLVVIDTGTRPTIPPIPGLAGTPYLTNLTWFEQEVLPKRVIVIGGGYIGLELGQGARRLGSEVTIIDAGARIMQSEESDASDVIAKSIATDGVVLHLGSKIESVSHDGQAFTVTLGDGTNLEAEGLLIAAGRTPNTIDLALEKSSVETQKKATFVSTNILKRRVPESMRSATSQVSPHLHTWRGKITAVYHRRSPANRERAMTAFSPIRHLPSLSWHESAIPKRKRAKSESTVIPVRYSLPPPHVAKNGTLPKASIAWLSIANRAR